MQNTPSSARQFEALIQRVLEVNGFAVTRFDDPRGIGGFDFMGELAGENWAIEVKFYRTARAQVTLIESAAARLVHRAVTAQTWRGMLVVSSNVPISIRLALEQKYDLTIVDRPDLLAWAAAEPSLVDEITALLELEPSETAEGHAPDLKTSTRISGRAPPVDTRGTILCRRLRALPRGKVAWRDYEQLCAEILKYLFPNDLLGWHTQKRTDDGLNRFDFVCRIRPTTEFWSFLIDHLDSRYVLFEFKNYLGQIKQGQILTTEKYLLEKGLRRAAIILTRAGAEKEAVRMTQGAMRENGKLMLVVDDERVCEMLHMKERGEDPTDCLFELADDFLLSLPR